MLEVGPGLLAAGDVELRERAASPVSVHLSREAREQINTEARGVPPSHETGGVLIARRSFSETRVDLCRAWGPGPSAHHGRDALVIDWRIEHCRARQLAEETDNALVGAGFWHTHPNGDLRPSDGDLRMFAAAMSHLSDTVWPVHRYVGVICAPPMDRQTPRMTAWVVRRQSWGSLVCERAEVITQ